MHPALTAVLLVTVVGSLPAIAQTRPKAPIASSTTSGKAVPDQRQLTLDEQGNAYQRKAEERHRTWEARMRETMKGICIGC